MRFELIRTFDILEPLLARQNFGSQNYSRGEWQLGHLSTSFVDDPTDKYVVPYGITIYRRTASLGLQSS